MREAYCLKTDAAGDGGTWAPPDDWDEQNSSKSGGKIFPNLVAADPY